ncbi:MAG: TIGR04086 family membrane protein [Bacillota bacterium]
MARRRRKQAEPTGVAPTAHLRGLGFALVLTAIFLLLITLLVSVTSITEIWARWLMVVCCGVAVFIGSYQTGRSMGRSGWFNGGATGLSYVVLMLLLALLLDLGLTARSLITLVAGFALGAIGGVIGVNNR